MKKTNLERFLAGERFKVPTKAILSGVSYFFEPEEVNAHIYRGYIQQIHSNCKGEIDKKILHCNIIQVSEKEIHAEAFILSHFVSVVILMKDLNFDLKNVR